MSDDLLDERIGRPAELAARAADEYRRSTWVARHPFWVFALLPLPAAVVVSELGMGVWGLGIEGAIWLFSHHAGEVPSSALVASAYGLTWFVGIVFPVLFAAFYSRLYLRHAVSRRWFVVAAVQVLLFAYSLLSIFEHSDVPGQSSYYLFLACLPRPTSDGWGVPLLHGFVWAQLVQVLATVAVGWLILRAGSRRRELVDAVGVPR